VDLKEEHRTLSLREPEIELAGETVRLLPECALYWASSKTVIIADLHLGKSSSMRAESIPIPEGTTNEDLCRLDSLLTRTGARRLLILGDVVHARLGLTGELRQRLEIWRSSWRQVSVLVVRGNHDKHAGELPKKLAVCYQDAPLYEVPFAFSHYPGRFENFYNLAGHVHPAVKLAGAGGQSERLPCFLFGERSGVIPAFGTLTGNLTVRPTAGERVFVVADQQVLQVSGGVVE
jgi:DNA ligase-associated metallophosphoesterase